MPKQKTHKGLSKRVRLTASGKVRHKRCCGGHLMSGKSAKRKRRISSPAILSDTAARVFKVKLSK